jgi:hypothetical protein
MQELRQLVAAVVRQTSARTSGSAARNIAG